MYNKNIRFYIQGQPVAHIYWHGSACDVETKKRHILLSINQLYRHDNSKIQIIWNILSKPCIHDSIYQSLSRRHSSANKTSLPRRRTGCHWGIVVKISYWAQFLDKICQAADTSQPLWVDGDALEVRVSVEVEDAGLVHLQQANDRLASISQPALFSPSILHTRWQHFSAPQLHLVYLCAAGVTERAALTQNSVEMLTGESEITN